MKKIIYFALLLSAFTTYSQSISGNLENYLNTKIDEMPGDNGNDYTKPEEDEINTWTTIVNNILADDIEAARTDAATLNYQIVIYTNTTVGFENVFYVLEEKLPQTKYWGTFTFAKNAIRPNLILQAPHAKKDTNTGSQAAYSFVRLNNKALFLSGTHRCNHTTKSTCAGTTSVCIEGDEKEAFRISDMAHNVETMFQKTTEILFDENDDSVFVQLHGFTKGGNDPYVIMSNGTNQVPATDHISSLITALTIQDNSLTFKVPHLGDQKWDRLAGFTNTQGRYINGSNSPCNQSAQNVSGRFVHIEQEKSKLRENSTGWNKMYEALKRVFVIVAHIDEDYIFQFNMANPFSRQIKFTAKDVINFSIYNSYGNKMYSYRNLRNKNTFTVNTKNYKRGIYHLRVQTKKINIFKTIIHK